jgi:uncharacterized protein YaaQ
MQMILAVMPTNTSDELSQKLIDSGYRVTKFASTAGLFSGGTTTLMVVAERAAITQALELIRSNSPSESAHKDDHPRITIYVLNVKDFERV